MTQFQLCMLLITVVMFQSKMGYIVPEGSAVTVILCYFQYCIIGICKKLELNQNAEFHCRIEYNFTNCFQLWTYDTNSIWACTLGRQRCDNETYKIFLTGQEQNKPVLCSIPHLLIRLLHHICVTRYMRGLRDHIGYN